MATHKPEARARIELRLTGGADGAIPLEDLAEVAKHAQELVRKLARAIVDKSGPGRPPAFLDQMTNLVAVGIHQGSAVLEIEAPSSTTEFELPEEIGFDAGIQAIEMVATAITSIGLQQPLPKEFTQSSRHELRELLTATSSYDRIYWTVSHHDRKFTASIDPSASTVLSLHDPARHLQESGTVEGELYALNAKTGTYTVEDLSGYAIRCHIEPGSFLASELDHLVRRAVRISGKIARDRTGRITDVDVEAIDGSFPQADKEFWEFDLDAALSDTPPISSIDDLALSELTSDEAWAFRQALGFE
jgi:hypothetical protein